LQKKVTNFFDPNTNTTGKARVRDYAREAAHNFNPLNAIKHVATREPVMRATQKVSNFFNPNTNTTGKARVRDYIREIPAGFSNDAGDVYSNLTRQSTNPLINNPIVNFIAQDIGTRASALPRLAGGTSRATNAIMNKDYQTAIKEASYAGLAAADALLGSKGKGLKNLLFKRGLRASLYGGGFEGLGQTFGNVGDVLSGNKPRGYDFEQMQQASLNSQKLASLYALLDKTLDVGLTGSAKLVKNPETKQLLTSLIDKNVGNNPVTNKTA
jgi:hypothetical protein